MGKRFSDTEKWKDPWFNELSPAGKVSWWFLCENCDQAGFWKRNGVLERVMCGFEITKEIICELNKGKDRVIEWEDRIWVSDFVFFQYGHLSPDCKPHKPIIELIERYRKKGFPKGINTLEEKEMEKEKEKEIKGGVGGSANELPDSEKARTSQMAKRREITDREKWFDEIWQKYPNKDGKKHAKRHFLESVKTAADYERISKALENYLRSKRVKEGFIKNGSTWFNDWVGWFEYSEEATVGKSRNDQLLAIIRGE